MNINSSISSNPCPRCSKPRIMGKTWTEEIVTLSGTSLVTHTMTICPDPKCQKLVEEKLAVEKVKSDQIKEAFEERARQKKIIRAQISFAKKKK